MKKLKGLLASRKFWAAVVGVAVTTVKAYRPDDFPLTEDQLTSVVALLAAYIVGTAVEDHGKAAAG